MAVGTPRHAVDTSGMAFEHAQAAPRRDLPQPHGVVIGPGEGALAVGTPRHAVDTSGVAERQRCLLETLLRFGKLGWAGARPAGFDELGILLLLVLCAPVDAKELRQGAFDWRVVESQGNKAPLFVQRVAKPERAGLHLRPV